MSEIDEFEKFHPRAIKLMRKRKDFIVIACDEPYYMRAYALIRQNEMAKGTWTPVDESCYIRDAELHVHPTTEQKCPACNGVGYVKVDLTDWQCPICRGTGISNRSGGG